MLTDSANAHYANVEAYAVAHWLRGKAREKLADRRLAFIRTNASKLARIGDADATWAENEFGSAFGSICRKAFVNVAGG